MNTPALGNLHKLISQSTDGERVKVEYVVFPFTEVFWLPSHWRLCLCNFCVHVHSFNPQKLIVKFSTCCFPSKKKAFHSLNTAKIPHLFRNYIQPGKASYRQVCFILHWSSSIRKPTDVKQAGVSGLCQRLIWHHLQQRPMGLPNRLCKTSPSVLCLGPQHPFPMHNSHISPPTETKCPAPSHGMVTSAPGPHLTWCALAQDSSISTELFRGLWSSSPSPEFV